MVILGINELLHINLLEQYLASSKLYIRISYFNTIVIITSLNFILSEIKSIIFKFLPPPSLSLFVSGNNTYLIIWNWNLDITCLVALPFLYIVGQKFFSLRCPSVPIVDSALIHSWITSHLDYCYYLLDFIMFHPHKSHLMMVLN